MGVILLKMWTRLSGIPGGKWLFSRIVARKVPYSGTIRAKVIELARGSATLQLKDRRGIRNHLDSVHAVALVNLGEMTSGISVMTALPESCRAIVTRISTQYFKKARGTLICECTVALPEITQDVDVEVQAEVKNVAGDVVSVTTVNWRVGPRPEKG